MSLSNVRSIYGIHSATLYNSTTRIPYGMLRVLQGSEFSLSGDVVPLQGGSSRFPWKVEDGYITAEMSLTFNEYPDWLYTVLLGKAPTDNAAEASGNVSTLTNANGTSAVAATGMLSATLEAGEEAELKFTKYVVKVVGATTVDVYAMSNVDFARGTDLTFENDALKITATPLTIATDTAVSIPNTGVEITGGAGTIAMTENDTAYFEVRPVSTDSHTVEVGANIDVFPTFGAVLYAQAAANGELFEIDVYNLKAIGLPHNFNAKAFSEASVTAQAFYNSTRGGVFSMRTVTPS